MPVLVSFRRKLPARHQGEAPRHLGFSAKKKDLENIQVLLIGGDGGNRTRVRKPSAVGSTCLFRLYFNCLLPAGRGKQTAIPVLV